MPVASAQHFLEAEGLSIVQIADNASGAISGDKFTNNCVVPSVGLGSQVLVAIDSTQQGVLAHGTNFNVTSHRVRAA